MTLVAALRDRRGSRARGHGRGSHEDDAPAAGERGAAQGQCVLGGYEHLFRERARPSLDEMIRFIAEYRDRFGVELICQVLRPCVGAFLTSRDYGAAKNRMPSPRQLHDDLLVPKIARLHAESYGVDGRRKMQALM